MNPERILHLETHDVSSFRTRLVLCNKLDEQTPGATDGPYGREPDRVVRAWEAQCRICLDGTNGERDVGRGPQG